MGSVDHVPAVVDVSGSHVPHPAAPATTPASAPVGRERRRTVWIIAGWTVVAAALRAPFIWTGLSMDEGGYAYVAQQWAHGQRLYDTAWLDRPQGLLLVYRLLLGIDDSGATIRAGAVLAGAAITVFVGVTGWLLIGRRAGMAAAAVYAVAGVAPHLEGFTLNGELLASVPASAAVACALMWRRTGLRRWLLAAGLAAGLALTMKQSGIDGVATGLAVVIVGGGPVRAWMADAGRFLAATAVPVGACAIHGWALGWSRYWDALIGYQVTAIGESKHVTGGRWHDLVAHLPTSLRDLVVLIAVAVVGMHLLTGRSRRIVVVWLSAGAVAVNLGGSYWPHYYVQLLPPLAILAGAAVTGVRRPAWRATLAAICLLPSLMWSAALVPMSDSGRRQAIPYYGRAVRDEHIAAVIRTVTSPDQQIFVIESEANIYFLARRTTSYPYLWGNPIEKVPQALPEMRAMLAGPHRPTLLVLNTNPATVDPSGALGSVLARYYHDGGTVDGVQLLRANRVTSGGPGR